MSLVTVNNVNVISGSIVAPLSGVWTADLVIDQPDGSGFAAGTAVTIKAHDGIELHGTVAQDRSGDFLEAVHVRVLGGAGGMGSVLTPKGYSQPGAFVRDVLNSIAQGAGETLSSEVSPALLATDLSAWNTLAVPASHALLALLTQAAPDADWRILPDGKLWIGEETWTSQTSTTFEILEQNPADKTFVLGVDTFDVMPGVDLQSVGKVARVEHTITTEHIRTRIWTDIVDDERGTRAGLAKIIRQEMAGIDYFTLYDAKVISQSEDKTTVDVQPGDSRLPGLSKVPLRLGIPGVTVQVSPGGFVRIGWDRGSPSMPYACLFQGGETVLQLTVQATDISLDATTVTLANGVLAVARQTDQVTGTAGPYPLANGQIAGGNTNVKA